jgi:TolB protein
MNADGSGQQAITSGTGADDNAAWSPSGKTIAFARKQNGKDAVYVMNADGSNQRRLIAGAQPTWSPDGQRIAFTSTGAAPDIYVVNVNGRGLRDLTRTRGFDGDPAWAPGRRRS